MSDKVTAWMQGEGEMPEPLDVACVMSIWLWCWGRHAKTGNVSEAESALCQLEQIINKIREEP